MSSAVKPILVAIVLLAMACAIVPPGTALAPVTLTAAEPGTSDVTALPLPANSISPVPLHVGYETRGSWFELYFTDPANPASGQATGGPDVRLVEAIDAARVSIHVAIFSISLNGVRQALIRAIRRGVEVRLVTESDNLDSDDLQRLKDAGIPVLGDRREGTMHNKFMVIDAAEVWTGSMNLTTSGTYLDNNVLIRIYSADLAADYEAEFAEMFEDDSFGADLGRSTPHPRVEVQGTPIDVYFAPDDAPEAALVDLLDTAQKSINFLAFSFTSDPLAGAVGRAAEAGVEVRGVMDSDQASSNIGSEFSAFRSEGLDVRLDRNPGQMHEKVLIIDEEVIVMGSYNFSRSANETNDENVLVIYNRGIAQEFMREFERIYATAAP